MTQIMDVAAIVAALADRTEAICWELFPQGVKDGAEFRIGSLAGEPGRSLGIRIRGSKQGVWCDFASGEAGDILDLISLTLFQGNKSQALVWARRYLGLDSEDPKAMRQWRRRAQARKDDSEKEARRARAQAWRIWEEASPNLRGAPAGYYLWGRGLDLAQLGYQPRSLRAHGRCWNAERNDYLPALLGAICGPDGKLTAVHRTYLEPAFWDDCLDQPRWPKAKLAASKKVLGPYVGAMIRLWRGGRYETKAGKRVWIRAPALNQITEPSACVITEGIEDGLTVAMAAPEMRVLVAVSLANIPNLALPPALRYVTICADNEDNPAARANAERALNKAVQRFTSEGRTVRLARSPVGKDFNDAIQERTQHG